MSYKPPRRYRRRPGQQGVDWDMVAIVGVAVIVLGGAGSHAAARHSHARPAHHASASVQSVAAGPLMSTASANVALGQRMAAAWGWTGGQWTCLNMLWTRESGWRTEVWNYQGSGAYGIPQSLPASKMASTGADWQTNPATQIRWGLGYIQGTYGTPCGAWAHEEADGWY